MPKTRKRINDEPALGTDSFLDVLCNMVGILVVLIVIAGLRASRNTDTGIPAPSDGQGDASSPFVVMLGAAVPLPGNSDTGSEDATTVVEPVHVAPPEDLVREAERLRNELAAVKRSLDATAEVTSPQTSEPPRIALEEIELAIQQDLLALQNETLLRQSAQVDLDQKRQALERAKVDFASIANSKPAPKVLQHRLAPLAKVVSSKEVHFRLSENRVSVVPIDALVEELQSQINRQKDFIMTRDRYTSTIGPLDGYRMEFAIQRIKAGNIADELKYGQSMVRMSVSGWVIRPENSIAGESADEALRPGSRFRQALQAAGSLATVTFWIYPDSFEIHRKLQDFAHEHDLNVAARPLPEGVPIAGSPQGSRSMAQ